MYIRYVMVTTAVCILDCVTRQSAGVASLWCTLDRAGLRAVQGDMPRRLGIGGGFLSGSTFVLGILAAFPVHAAEANGAPPPSPVFPALDPAKDPGEVFDLAALGVVRVGTETWRAYRGKYRDFVEQDDFFDAVGRHDLASRMRSARLEIGFLSYGGRTVALVGALFVFARASPGGFDPPLGLGLGMVGGGLLAWALSGFVSTTMATPEAAEALAGQYNQGLRAHIEQRQRTPATSGTVARAWRMPLVVPWTAGKAAGSGLSLALAF
jgi:hypothetical protein